MLGLSKRRLKFYTLTFFKHDFKASITVFFVALPLCLGISLASDAPVYSGLIAGIVGGLVIGLLSKSQLSVSGPAAGLTAICAAAIQDLGGLEIFFVAVAMSGIIQLILGVFKLGGFTHFIPSAVIKGMLTAIGIILISKQIPALIGYTKPEFWSNELFNIIKLNHVFSNVKSLYASSSRGVILVALLSLGMMFLWRKYLAAKVSFLPESFVTVLFGSFLALIIRQFFPALHLFPEHFVNIPSDIVSQVKFPDFYSVFKHKEVWQTAIVIAFVASLETLLSVEAIDKIDPYNRLTPVNRELMAQGTGNFFSGLLGGLPVTAVIVRSSANAEAGGHTKLSAIFHGLWLLIVVLLAIPLVNNIPYCVLAVILIRTGYNLAKPSLIKAVYKQGREQFLPYIITVGAILVTDLLIGVLIGVVYSIYFIIKHTYEAGFILRTQKEGHGNHYVYELTMNVSYLNKKKFRESFDKIPVYSTVEIDGRKSTYIDNDILEIIHDFRAKAHKKHIELKLINIPDVETVALH